jgi:addiction module HigA family antidote
MVAGRAASYEARVRLVSLIDKCKATGFSALGEDTELHSQGLKKLYAEDSAKGVPLDSADKLRKMLAFLDDM